MLAAVGLDHPCDRQKRAGALSGGMRRRLSTALALAGNPSVVVLDEPTAGLGERSARRATPFTPHYPLSMSPASRSRPLPPFSRAL